MIKADQCRRLKGDFAHATEYRAGRTVHPTLAADSNRGRGMHSALRSKIAGNVFVTGLSVRRNSRTIRNHGFGQGSLCSMCSVSVWPFIFWTNLIGNAGICRLSMNIVTTCSRRLEFYFISCNSIIGKGSCTCWKLKLRYAYSSYLNIRWTKLKMSLVPHSSNYFKCKYSGCIYSEGTKRFFEKHQYLKQVCKMYWNKTCFIL